MSDRIRDGIVFGDTRRKDYWDKLIPQVLWRGTDFAYLHLKHPEMRPPNYKQDILPFEGEVHPTDGRWAINALYRMGETLLPRWKGVLLTSEAEIEECHPPRPSSSLHLQLFFPPAQYEGLLIMSVSPRVLTSLWGGTMVHSCCEMRPSIVVRP